jgi:hypothetical protein
MGIASKPLDLGGGFHMKQAKLDIPGTISITQAAKLLGCNTETIRAGIDNETFKWGFKFKGKGEWIYKVAEKPLLNFLNQNDIFESYLRETNSRFDMIISLLSNNGET